MLSPLCRSTVVSLNHSVRTYPYTSDPTSKTEDATQYLVSATRSVATSRLSVRHPASPARVQERALTWSKLSTTNFALCEGLPQSSQWRCWSDYAAKRGQGVRAPFLHRRHKWHSLTRKGQQLASRSSRREARLS